ncbi:restriction endonuclease subunit S [Empedobacter sp. 189-2]|uniref:restriction endonuclease subunit S n=1 Tax=Empedobacter sp. 189-2 TaxID=2746724 RepID=UPI00257715AB|nr:restriction endonuclease subunit S [Empedobacter sp. 189-2]MDM1542664.1 restriction endonuclease subunit S [Empedobacter sp. 189-2]
MREVKLGSLDIKFIDGDRGKNYPKQEDLLEKGYCLFLSAKNITSDGFQLNDLVFITEEKDNLLRKGKLEDNDIIITTRGTIGNVCIYNNKIPFKNVRINSGMLIIRNESLDINTDYLYQFLKSDIFRERTRTFAFGAAVPQLPISTLVNIKINLPPLETQKRIASILSGYDDLIENNLKRIKILEEMAQQTYEEWFVRMRFPGHDASSASASVNEETSETERSRSLPEGDALSLPKGWEKVKLKDCCDLVMGQSPKSEFYNDEKLGLPFHQGVKDYGFRFPINTSWSTAGNKKAKPNSILFSVRAPVGRLNVAAEEIILGRGLAAINHKKELNSFIFYQLRKIFFEDNLIGGGAIFASVTKTDVERIELIYNEELAIKFNDFASKIDQQILNLTNQNQRLREARDILLPRLMMGMIEV